MVEQTIQVIRDTEAKADTIVRTAQEDCTKIIEEAVKKAAEIKAEELQKVKEKAEASMKLAQDDGEKVTEEQTSRIEKEVQALKALALDKEEEAISLVISQLVG